MSTDSLKELIRGLVGEGYRHLAAELFRESVREVIADELDVKTLESISEQHPERGRPVNSGGDAISDLAVALAAPGFRGECEQLIAKAIRQELYSELTVLDRLARADKAKAANELFNQPEPLTAEKLNGMYAAWIGAPTPEEQLHADVNQATLAAFGHPGVERAVYLAEKIRVIGQTCATLDKLNAECNRMLEQTAFELGSELLREGAER